MPVIAGLVVAKFAVYAGALWGLAAALQVGAPLDALRAAFHRTWLGAAATMGCLVAYMITKMLHAGPDAIDAVVTFFTWALRVALWIWVLTSVYRVTRWRKGRLAIFAAALLALDFGIDVGLARLQQAHPFMPALGEWTLRLC
jgi:hypothetical protein